MKLHEFSVPFQLFLNVFEPTCASLKINPHTENHGQWLGVFHLKEFRGRGGGWLEYLICM